jgi:hypothetical protein
VKLCRNGDENEASQELSARKTMTTAEWGVQLPSAVVFIPLLETVKPS